MPPRPRTLRTAGETVRDARARGHGTHPGAAVGFMWQVGKAPERALPDADWPMLLRWRARGEQRGSVLPRAVLAAVSPASVAVFCAVGSFPAL